MTTTPILALEELASAQAIPEVTVNESVRWLEFFGTGGKVLDRGLAAPPGSPADGDCYLVAASATGAWAGHVGDIAMFLSTAWAFKDAKEGMRLYVADEDVTIVYDGAAWSSVSGTTYTDEQARDAIGAALVAGPGVSIVVNDAGDTITITATKAPAVQSVTSSATVTPTFSDDLVKITAQAAGLTLANWSGTAVPGWGLVIRIKDNGTARSIAYGTKYRALGVTLPTTTVVGKTLYLGCIYNSDDDKFDVVAVAQEA